MSQWSRARVNIDYHIAFDANFYSVPYTLVQELIEVRATATTVEIFHRGQRVASHLRGRGRGQVLTEKEHRPKSHQAHLEWTPSRMVHWAEQIGPHTARLFERILAEKPHPEMGYRSLRRCKGICAECKNAFAALKARVDRLTFKGKYTEDALVHASKWFLTDESLQSLNPESELTQGQRPLR